METEEVEILKRALDHYGIPMQIVVAVEEFSELTQTLCKVLREDSRETLHAEVIDEIADALLMMTQLVLVFNTEDDKVGQKIKEKIARLTRRMDADKNQTKITDYGGPTDDQN